MAHIENPLNALAVKCKTQVTIEENEAKKQRQRKKKEPAPYIKSIDAYVKNCVTKLIAAENILEGDWDSVNREPRDEGTLYKGNPDKIWRPENYLSWIVEFKHHPSIEGASVIGVRLKIDAICPPRKGKDSPDDFRLISKDGQMFPEAMKTSKFVVSMNWGDLCGEPALSRSLSKGLEEAIGKAAVYFDKAYKWLNPDSSY
jgi:hypothetical protein